jgi:cell wall-associated NlpC family hydrolase
MSRVLAIVGSLIGLSGLGLALAQGRESSAAAVPTDRAALRYERHADPARTVVRLRSTGAVVATLTDGARTVVLPGPPRTFAEPKFTTSTVTSTTWVRLLPKSWEKGAEREVWFRRWLDRQSSSTKPDVLAIANQYIDGRPDVRNGAGIRFRGDAAFGPLTGPSGRFRQESSDFYDFLGVDWTFSDGETEKPEPRRYGAVDCSGFVRLVYGYRMGLPLLNVNGPGPGLPRRAYAIAGYARGKMIIPNALDQAKAYDRLQPGDLVFFDINGGPQIDHVGIYLGRDNSGHHRFISSRGRANGPTFGDLGGTALLDDDGYYSRAFRTAKRL